MSNYFIINNILFWSKYSNFKIHIDIGGALEGVGEGILTVGKAIFEGIGDIGGAILDALTSG